MAVGTEAVMWCGLRHTVNSCLWSLLLDFLSNGIGIEILPICFTQLFLLQYLQLSIQFSEYLMMKMRIKNMIASWKETGWLQPFKFRPVEDRNTWGTVVIWCSWESLGSKVRNTGVLVPALPLPSRVLVARHLTSLYSLWRFSRGWNTNFIRWWELNEIICAKLQAFWVSIP